jgi:choline dehydrogenase
MFDHVVVGGGSAGCVVAARLSEDPARKVLLLEAGGSDRALTIRAPGLYFALWRSKHDWAFATEPQPQVDGRRMFWPRGKVLGGSGSLNASLYVRGHRDDYDGWRDAGNPGWGWSDVLPYFVRAEDQQRGRSAAHGVGGPLRVEDQPASCTASSAFVAALAARCGVPVVDDFNSGDSEGAGHYQVTCRGGQRWSTARGYLEPARARPNLTVVTGAHVLGVTTAGTRVTGVRYRVGSRDETAATAEVVLCGGAIGSPQLLMLSGIGPAAHLRAHGIPVVVDLPGVGQNLQDHLFVGVTFEPRGDATPLISRLGLLRNLARFVARSAGPFARSPIDAGGFVRTRPDAPRPDLQFHVAPLPTFEPNWDEKRPLGFGRQLTILPSLLYPRSRGEIRLRSKDPAAAPAIDPRYFSDPADLELLVAGVKLTREIVGEAPLRALCGVERRPGPRVTDDDAIRACIRRHVETIFHPVGTCAMGSGPDAVVDATLRVRGLDGLRVADASVMPTIVGGNTNAPTVMIAEKAAAMIRA